MEVAQLILGNSNKRFSGVTSTMLQTLPEVRKLMPLAVMGRHHLPSGTSTIRFWDLILLRDRIRIFHALHLNRSAPSHPIYPLADIADGRHHHDMLGCKFLPRDSR